MVQHQVVQGTASSTIYSIKGYKNSVKRYKVKRLVVQSTVSSTYYNLKRYLLHGTASSGTKLSVQYNLLRQVVQPTASSGTIYSVKKYYLQLFGKLYIIKWFK